MPTSTPNSIAAARLEAAIEARNKLDYMVIPVIPRFLEALDAFEDLQIHQEKHDNGERVKVALLGEWKHAGPSLREPAVYKFLRSLPRVGVRRIPNESRDCMVCQQPFSFIGGKEAVMATKMPCCSQYVCSFCINTWLRPFEAASQNTCIHCRAVLFEKLPDPETMDGIRARLDIIKWSEQKLRMRFTARDQATFRTYKIALFCEQTDAALLEARRYINALDQLKPDAKEQKSKLIGQSKAREVWLRYATIQYLAIQMQVARSNGGDDPIDFLERELLKTLSHVRYFLAYEDVEEAR